MFFLYFIYRELGGAQRTRPKEPSQNNVQGILFRKRGREKRGKEDGLWMDAKSTNDHTTQNRRQ